MIRIYGLYFEKYDTCYRTAFKEAVVTIIDETATNVEGEIRGTLPWNKIVFDGYLKAASNCFLTSPKGYKLLLTGDKGFKRS